MLDSLRSLGTRGSKLIRLDAFGYATKTPGTRCFFEVGPLALLPDTFVRLSDLNAYACMQHAWGKAFATNNVCLKWHHTYITDTLLCCCAVLVACSSHSGVVSLLDCSTHKEILMQLYAKAFDSLYR